MEVTMRKTVALIALAACSSEPEPIFEHDGVYAPGPDLSQPAVDGIEVGNRLMAAEEYELALDAFTRAALDEGMTAEVLIGLGTANLGLGRLGQSERLLRRATEDYAERPEAWNNLGVLLMESGKVPEAQQVFRKAYALDNGESDSIRDNLRLSLEKNENFDTLPVEQEEYKLVRRSGGDVLLKLTPP
jgi:Flp pilus assembly protein TadD